MQLQIDQGRCTLCGACVQACPFGALVQQSDGIEIGPSCRLCKLCIRSCPEEAISLTAQSQVEIDKSLYTGVLVIAETQGNLVHPVTYELLGKGRELADKVGHCLSVVVIGNGIAPVAAEMLDFGVDTAYTFDAPELSSFRIEPFANAATQVIETMKPSVILVGATPLGRSLAPRIAVRFRTGLTADCTLLSMKDNTDLVQIRPAFGGNIMAQIVTPKHRPQMATVRYKVMDPAVQQRRPNAKVVHCRLSKAQLNSRSTVLSTAVKPPEENIADAEVIVAAGRGLKNRQDLQLAQRLADLLGGQLGVTRPLVEMGWAQHSQQIGLSGRTVRPKLLITVGVSGAIQFSASISGAELIFAINNDPAAPIFETAHYGMVGDLYEILPKAISRLEKGEPIDAIL